MTWVRDGPLEKWWGGWGVGKKPKKIHARENAKKKIYAKKKVKKKNHAEGRSNCDFFRKYEFQKATVSLSSYWKETIRALFLFQIAASVPTTYSVYCIIIKIMK